MLIRQEQIEHFDRTADKECFDFTSEFLRENALEIVEPLPPEVFLERVRRGINLARRYELEVFADIASFVYFLFRVGPDFHEDEPFHSILIDSNIDPDDRMTVLVETATDDDWFQSQDASDPAAWERLG